ncbi:hypothetical protein [Metaclostridioides mangenotii]|uniref:hypothetical protein n=1 Tax=Metaclostridioides mangenotii TaxID=1540 RepID=UPI00163AD8F9|nr:hypothetical protein [Clostridioides mangenotii]
MFKFKTIIPKILLATVTVNSVYYKSYMYINAYAIGGGASIGLEKFPDNATKFVSNDFKETYRKVVKWLEDRKFM